jgi:hypothetical protein
MHFHVDAKSVEFSLEVHHGGFFTGHGNLRSYVNGRVNWFDNIEIETWSPLWLDQFIVDLGYLKTTSFKIYWLLPGKSIADGLRIISGDFDTNVMASVVDKFKNLVVYFDHDDSYMSFDWDDIIANPVVDLPKVISPKKVHHLPKKDGEKLPSFYTYLSKQSSSRRGVVRNRATEQQQQMNEGQRRAATAVTGQQQQHQMDEEERTEAATAIEQQQIYDSGTDASDDNDTDYYDFLDSDYELSEDDDLFADNERRKIAKGKKAKGSRLKGVEVVQEGNGEDSSSEDSELDMPEEDEGHSGVKMKFKSWREEDMNNPTFKVGLVFPSVEKLREAITEYGIRNRVQIKLPRNDKQRVRAHCVEGKLITSNVMSIIFFLCVFPFQLWFIQIYLC